jgi:16S rRNA (cytidine1402-2'-O)-methyltransferase
VTAPGALILVGTPIGNLGDLSPRAVATLGEADAICAEDTRRTRQLLSHAGIPGGSRLIAVHAHNERRIAGDIVERIRRGNRVAYVTDAGMPGISDPGEHLVAACVAAGLPVELVPGPSAALSALVLSGLPTGRFSFEGFLPRKGQRRAERLARIAIDDRTTVVYESPHRVGATLVDLSRVCGPDRRVAVARELTKRFEEVWRGTAGVGAERWDGLKPLGEHVIVIAPALVAVTEIDDDDLAEAIEDLLDAGTSARDAADEVAGRFGVARRRAYAIANHVKAMPPASPDAPAPVEEIPGSASTEPSANSIKAAAPPPVTSES